jgi:hypothetical protein
MTMPKKDKPPREEPEQFVEDPDDSEFVEIDPDHDPDEVRPSALRVAGRVSARVVIGAVVVAAVAIVVIAASSIPLPKTVARPAGASAVVTPIPTADQLVCPGGLLRLSSASGNAATKSSSLGAPTVTDSVSVGQVSRTAFSASDAGTANRASAPQLLTSSTHAAQAFVSGAQSQTVATDEFAGLASAACSTAGGGAWLSGGSTSVGRTTLLLLSNPTDVAATVNIHIFGENGPVTAPGTEGVVVAPHDQRVLSLAGFAPGLVSPVIHVQSKGGEVVANLEQSTVRGLAPGGIDFVGSSPSLSTTTVIPGVVVTGTDAVQGQLGQSGFDDLQTTLRLYVPGPKSVDASVSIISETGATSGKALKVNLDPGKVTDLPLDDVTNGSYTVRITTPSPITASVRVSTAGTAAVASQTDFAWLVPAPLLTSSALVSVATGMNAAIHLDNPTKASEVVTLKPIGGGAGSSVTVPAGSAMMVPATGGTTYRIGGFTRLYASVSGTTDGGVTGYVVSPSQLGSGPIRVYG